MTDIEFVGPPAPPTVEALGNQLAAAFATAKPLVPTPKPITPPPAPIVTHQTPKPNLSPFKKKSERRDGGKTLLDRLEFDRYIVQYYSNKLNSCKSRGIAFNLTFLQVKNLLRAKKCQYTGVELTHTMSNTGGQRDTDLTIERIDSNRPYETGNVCAVSFAANQAKSMFDAKFGADAVKMIHEMSKQLKKRGVK